MDIGVNISSKERNIFQYLITIPVPGTILASGLFMGIGIGIINDLKL